MSTSAGARRGASASASDSQGGATESTVLEEVNDPNYEPDQDEIEEYAEWLGMDLDRDKSLFWIAREGIKAQLPPSWKPCKAPNGDVYYFNFESGESIWDHPCDVQFREIFKAAKKSKEIDQLTAPPRSALPPLSSRSIDCEPEEEDESGLHTFDIAFADDPLKVKELQMLEAQAAPIPALITKLDFNRLCQAAQKVAETTLQLAESARLALEGEGSVGELRLLDDISSKLGLPRPSQVPAIDLAVLWADLAPVLETAAAQSDVQSEEYSMLSTLRDAAQLASGEAALSDEAINNSCDNNSFIFPSLEATGEGSTSSQGLLQHEGSELSVDVARLESARRKGTMSRASMVGPESPNEASMSPATSPMQEPAIDPKARLPKEVHVTAQAEMADRAAASASEREEEVKVTGGDAPVAPAQIQQEAAASNPVQSKAGVATSLHAQERSVGAVAQAARTEVAAGAHNAQRGEQVVNGKAAHVEQAVGAAGAHKMQKERKGNKGKDTEQVGAKDTHSVQAAHCVLGLLDSQGLLSARGKAEAAQDGIGDVVRHIATHSVTSEVAKLKAEIAILRKAMNHGTSAGSVMTSSVTASNSKAQGKSSDKHRSRQTQQSSLMESRGRVRPRSAGINQAKHSSSAKQSTGPKSGLCRTAHGEMSGLLGQLQNWSSKELGKDRPAKQKNERQSTSKHSASKRTSSRPGSALDGHRAATVAASFSTFNGPKVKQRQSHGSGMQQRTVIGRRSASVNSTLHSSQKSSSQKSGRQSKLSTLERKNHAKPAPSSRSTVFIGASHHNTAISGQTKGRSKVLRPN